MASSRISREWARRIDSGAFTHAQCRAFCRTVIATAEDGEAPRYTRSSLTKTEARELVSTVRRRGGMALEDAHTAAGRAWIAKPKIRDAFPAWVFDEFDRFTFPGYAHRLRNGLGEVSHRIPVWRIHGKRGQTLDYYAASWQSGAGYGPNIIRESAAPEMVAYDPTPRELELARDWYAGQGSALYAIASTGKLSLGTIRPYGEDGPMDNADWLEHLRHKLYREVSECAQESARGDDDVSGADAADLAAWRDKLAQVVS